jgi:hypothetical protein
MRGLEELIALLEEAGAASLLIAVTLDAVTAILDAVLACELVSEVVATHPAANMHAKDSGIMLSGEGLSWGFIGCLP